MQATGGQALVIQVSVFGYLGVQIQDPGSCLVDREYSVGTAWKRLATTSARAGETTSDCVSWSLAGGG